MIQCASRLLTSEAADADKRADVYERDMDIGLDAAHDLSLSFEEIGLAMPETPEEIRSWEIACHRELRDAIEALRGDDAEPDYVSVELAGSFPDTAIEVHYRPDSDEDERVRRCELWKGTFYEYAGAEPPGEVAQMILTWVRDGA